MKQRPIDALAIAVLSVLLAIVCICLGTHLGLDLGLVKKENAHLPGLVLVLYIAPVVLAFATSVWAALVISEVSDAPR